MNASVSSLPWRNGLDQLRTIREPHSPMLTFRLFLRKFASAEPADDGSAYGHGGTSQRTAWKDTWVLLDIKVDIL